MLDLHTLSRAFRAHSRSCPVCGGVRIRQSVESPGLLPRLLGLQLYECLECAADFPLPCRLSLPTEACPKAEGGSVNEEEHYAGWEADTLSAFDRELDKISRYVDPWDVAGLSEPAEASRTVSSRRRSSRPPTF
jgi:hypothetical protein